MIPGQVHNPPSREGVSGLRGPWDVVVAWRRACRPTAAVHPPSGAGSSPVGQFHAAPVSLRVDEESRVVRVPERGSSEMQPGASTPECLPEEVVPPLDLPPLEMAFQVLGRVEAGLG